MVSEYNAQTAKLTHQYEEKLTELAQQKDVQRDHIRSELQAKVDELNH